MKPEINVRKQTNIKYKLHLGYFLSYGAFYACLILICMALAFFFPETLIITVPLLIIPFTFAFQFSTAIDNNSINDQGFSLGRLFKIYPSYFRRQFYGVYRALEGLLKSLAVFFCFYILIGLVTVYSSIFNDPEIMAMISSIELMTDYTSIETVIFDTLLNNETFLQGMYLAGAIAIFPAFLMFIHHIGTNSIKVHLEVASGQQLPMRDTHFIHRFGFRTFRKQFYKDYFKTVWWFTPLLAVLYYSGMTLGFFLFNKNPIEMSVLGLSIAIFVLSFILPYYFSAIETLFAKYQSSYIEASIAKSVQSLNELKARKQLTPDEEKEIQMYINETETMLKKSMEDDEEEQKNSDDSES